MVDMILLGQVIDSLDKRRPVVSYYLIQTTPSAQHILKNPIAESCTAFLVKGPEFDIIS